MKLEELKYQIKKLNIKQLIDLSDLIDDWIEQFEREMMKPLEAIENTQRSQAEENMTKFRFKRWPGSDLWQIANLSEREVILCTSAERRRIQKLKIGEKLTLQDWARFWVISRSTSGDEIEEKIR